jgi:hypothetical protein
LAASEKNLVTEQKTKPDRFNWWLALYAALSALVLFLPPVVWQFDVFFF